MEEAAMKHEDRNTMLFDYTKALSVALCYRDQMTQLHSERVQTIAETIGEACGLSESELNALRVAATFHDIGKIGIPDNILLKPARFDEEEWQVMKRHSEIGAAIIAATELEGSEQAAFAILHHHEHFDGTGYPDGLTGEDIPISSRIISLADSYDAMSMTRSYHRPKTHVEIMLTMEKESGGKHDPDLMHIFTGIVESSDFKATQ
jgi:HD-GYP domain-containing protein (c-di-GMP phosphodiesterase class II)